MKKYYYLTALFIFGASRFVFSQITFNYTGAAQTYVVPAGVTVICFTVEGAQGMTNVNNNAGGGLGGRVMGSIPVVAGQVLQINVGSGGSVSNVGGYNGGANGGVDNFNASEFPTQCLTSWGGGGGGGSDIRFLPYGLVDRFAVGGGGGGTGGDRQLNCSPGCGGGGGGGWYGGGGGGAYGGSPGFGGTQAAGGAGGPSCCGCPLSPQPGAAGIFGGGGAGGNLSGGNLQYGSALGCVGGVGGALVGGQGPNCTGGTGCPSTWAGASGAGGSNFMSGAVIGPTTTAGVRAGNGRVILIPNCCTQPTITPVANPNPICAGQTITLTATGAGTGGTYTWTPGPITGSMVTVTPAATTIYTVSGTNTMNCVGTQTILLTVNPSPTVTASSATVCDGIGATLTAAGAVTYTWQPGNIIGPSASFTPAATTVYTVTGTSASGCTASTTATITVNPLPVVLPASNSPICSGNALNLSVNAASSYTWAGPNALASNAQNPTILNATIANSGNYTVSVTNASGCKNTATINVVVNPSPTITSTSATVCLGVGATLNAAGANTYTWLPGNIIGPSVTFTPAATTVYTVTGTSASGCTASTTATIVVNPAPAVFPNSNSPVCTGGTINLTVGAAASYTWAGPNAFASNAQNPNINNVTAANAGNYTVTVTSALGCTASAVVNVIVNATPTITPSNSGPYCSGNTIFLTVAAAASYTWTGPNAFTSNAQSPFILNAQAINAGVYTVTVTAVGGCKSTGTTNVIVNPSPTITASSATVCLGFGTTLNAGGAITYTWQPGNIIGPSASFTPAATTVYTVTGTSASGCTASTTGTITVNPLPVVLPNSNSPVCSGSTINLTVGAAASYTWAGPNAFASNAQNPNINNATTINQGNYTVTVTSALGCTASAVVNVIVNSTPTLTPTNTGPYCSGTNIILSVAAAASYTWSGPNAFASNAQNPVIPNAQAVNAGNYTVTVTAVGGCMSTGTTNVIVNPTPTITVNSGTVCLGNGATLNAAGANTYTWQPGNINASSVTFFPLVTTVYTITGTSASGCTSTANATITVNPLPVIVVNSPTTCVGSTFTLTATGGTAYAWSGPNAYVSALQNPPFASASTSLSGNYTVVVTSAQGCTSSAVANLLVVTLPTVTIVGTNTLCSQNFNASPNTVVLTAGGATTFTWTLPAGYSANPNLNSANITLTPSITAVQNITTVSVIGSAGSCTSSAVFNLTVNPNPTITVTSASMCAGNSVTLTVNNASTYTWTPAASLNTANGPVVIASPSVTTVYSIIGSSVGCNSQTQNATASVVPNPTVTIVPGNPVICLGNSINLTASGATIYTWTPSTALTTTNTANTTASPTITTTYSVLGSQATCTNLATITVTVSGLPSVTVTASSPTLCMNNFNASPNTVSLTASGAGSYTWGPIIGLTTNTINGATIIGTSDGSSAIGTGTVLGANGTCTSISTFTVNAIANPTIAVTSGSMCAGTSVTLTANNASTYTWTPAASLNTANGPVVIASPSVTTVYSIIGSSVGCNSQTQNATANVVPNPTVTIVPANPVICFGDNVNLTAVGATIYTWTPSTALTTTNTANTTASPTITTTYSILGSQATCTNIGVVTVSVINLPVINIVATSPTLCMNNFNGSPNTVSLTASGATTYTWGPITGLTTNTLNGATIIGTSDGISPVGSVTVVGTAGTCTNVSTFTVNAIANPTIAVTSGSMCAGTSVTLTANNASTYTWTPAASLNTANGPVVIASPSVTTVYSIIGSSVGCNSQTQNATANVVPNPTVTIVPANPVICFGDNVNLTAVGATIYTWTPSTALTTTNTANTTASPTITTTYSILGSQATCTNIGVVTVSVINLPVINIVATSPTLCMNNFNGSPNTVSLTASGATTYTWGPITGLTTNTLNGATIIGTSDGISPVGSVTVVGTAGTCTNVSTFTVSAIANPTIAVTSGSMCAGTSVVLTANNATTYTWTPGASLNMTSGPSVIASPSVTTMYSVIGSSVGCNSQTQNGTASVVANPTVTIAPLTPTICFGNSIGLTASGATNYTWSPNTAITATIGANVTVNPTVTTMYTIIGEQATCTNVATSIVTVIALPVININLNTPNICMNNFNGSTNTVNINASGATTYTWTGFTGLNANTTSGAFVVGTAIPNAAIGSGTVVGFVGTCSNVASFSVIAIPNPTISVPSESMCAGTSVVLNASGADTYVWAPSNSLSSPFGSSVIASPSVTTIYGIVGTSLNCNSTTELSTVTIVANPTVFISSVNPTICAGSSIVLSASGADTYTWSPGSSLDNTTNINVIATPLGTTIYTLIGSASACTAFATREVTVIPLPTLQAICERTAICEGDQTNINANGADSYTWSPSTSLTSATSNFVIANPLVSTVYSLIGTNGLCTATLSVPIEVIAKPVLNLTTTNPRICIGQSAVIFASGAQAYSWTPTGNANITNTTMATVSPSVSTNYTVTGYNFSGTTACPFTKEILIEIVPQVTATINNSVAICEGESVKLSAGGSNTYIWAPATGLNNSLTASPYANPKTTTVYTVQISNGGFCGTTATVLVKVNPQPTVDAGPDATYNLDDPMYLNARGTGTLTWIFGEGILCKDCPNSQIMPTNSGCYQVQTVNQNGCKAIDEVCIEVTKDYEIYIPNIFTPNYDGLNDVFLVYGAGITKLELMIFDRWGEKIFVSEDQSKGWDGTIRGQDDIKQDVYTYVVNFTTIANKKYTKTGHVTLMK